MSRSALPSATSRCSPCSCAPPRCSPRSTARTSSSTASSRSSGRRRRVVPLFVVYGAAAHRHPRVDLRRGAAGDRLVHRCLQGVLDGAINPGLQAVVDHIRKGTLDFVLLKPADAQFLVSTARFQLWRVVSLVNAGGRLRLRLPRDRPRRRRCSAWRRRWCSSRVATLLLYSLWILIVSAAFYVVKVDNLTYLFSSIFDAARWPGGVFRGGAALRLHLRHSAQRDDHLPGGGAARAARAHVARLVAARRRGLRRLRARRVARVHLPLHLRGRLTAALRRQSPCWTVFHRARRR